MFCFANVYDNEVAAGAALPIKYEFIVKPDWPRLWGAARSALSIAPARFLNPILMALARRRT
jgi:hypothetical protein